MPKGKPTSRWAVAQALPKGLGASTLPSRGGTTMSSIRIAAHRAALVCFAFIAGVIGSSAFAHDDDSSFVASWAVGHINPLPAGTAHFSNQTLREIVRSSIGGDEGRVRISNVYGSGGVPLRGGPPPPPAGGAQILSRPAPAF